MGKRMLALLLLGAVVIALSVGYYCREQDMQKEPSASCEDVWEEKS